jgi:hypothetical protein
MEVSNNAMAIDTQGHEDEDFALQQLSLVEKPPFLTKSFQLHDICN